MCTRLENRRRGLTLLELLVVVLIVALVSAVALPTIIPAIQHRQVSEAARALQGALAGARDKAIHDGRPSGIRLLPDPVFFHGTQVVGQTIGTDGQPVPITAPAPLRLSNGTIDPSEVIAYNRLIPIGPAPEYSEGFVTVRSAAVLQKTPYTDLVTDPTGFGLYRWPTLVLEEAPFSPKGSAVQPPPNPPTAWSWNIRVGDKVQINGAGSWYTVVGPCWAPAAGRTFKDAKGNDVFVANPELFVNVGPPGFPSPLGHEYLLLANGRDDNGNGLADEGWDGIDNNGDGLVDEHLPDKVIASPVDPSRQTTRDEWEAESWHGAAASGIVSQPYVIRRRPMPSPNAREIALPPQMVVDATTVFATAERSRLPVDRFTGFVDILLNPDGTVSFNSPYGAPSSFGLADTFYHFWLSERQDVAAPTGTTVPLLPIAEPGGKSNKVFGGQVIKGEWALLTLFARTGQIVAVENPPFDDPRAVTKNRPFNVNLPYIAVQQGAR